MIWAQLGVGGGGSCEPGKQMCRRYAPLVGVELADGVERAALLAEALRDAAQHDHRRRGVLEAHLVAPVVVLRDNDDWIRGTSQQTGGGGQVSCCAAITGVDASVYAGAAVNAPFHPSGHARTRGPVRKRAS